MHNQKGILMMSAPEYIEIPVLHKKVARVGFGCCPMGLHDWGATDETELIRAVHAALDKGVNLFDTADIYGIGVSEKVLGKALKGRRHEAVITTKFGVRVMDGKTFYDNSSAWINQAVDSSLSRLQTDYIDLYQVHYWDGKTPFAKIFDTLRDLQKAGKILAFGVTNIDLVSAGFVEPIESLASFSFEYGLSKRIHEPEIYLNHDSLGLSFFSWGSLGQGILSGKYDSSSVLSENDRRRREVYRNFHGKKLANNLRIVDYMKEIVPHYKNKTLAQMAVRWILDQVPFSIALTGIKRESQLEDNVGALGWSIDHEHHSKLCELSDFKADISQNHP